MNEVAHSQARHNRQSPTSTQKGAMVNPINSTMENSQSMFSSTSNQLLSQSDSLNLHSVIDNTSPHSQDNFGASSTNNNSSLEDCRFQYVLAAATSIASKQNDSLTYLNQGQSYEVKMEKLGDLSMYRANLLKSVIRICFHERRLQNMEKEQMDAWQKARPGDRMLEVDIPLSYGAFDITQPSSVLNMISFGWHPTKEVGVYIKVNCISTEFTPKKNGGEKGVPFRIEVETYQNGDALTANKRLHAAACQIKVFKPKGADRKHRQDRDKIMKRPMAEQEKYQPSFECTVLNDFPNQAVPRAPTRPAFVPFSTAERGQGFLNVAQHAPNKENSLRNQQSLVPQRNLNLNHVSIGNDNYNSNELTQFSNTDETVHWLTINRFDKYLDIFAKFSGSDMLRMSKEDLIQICGQADVIRLYNALHLKKLKLYICRENTAVFNAIFLSSHNHMELVQKLCTMVSINIDQVKSVYIEGPHSIQIQLSDDVLRHIEEEAMFSLALIQDNGSHILMLKRRMNN